MLKIADLRNGMINVQIQGIVRRKSELNEGTKGKYFNFQLFDSDVDSIRIVGFKNAAEKWFSKIENEKSYDISKVSVKKNTFNNIESLQIVLTTDSCIVPSQKNFNIKTGYIALSELRHKSANTAVDIIGRVLKSHETERILTNGETKNVLIVTLMDEHVYVDLTFWEHVERITEINGEDLKKTIIGIENGIVKIYKGAITVNVGKSSIIHINPMNETAEKLGNITADSASFNLSAMSESTVNTSEYSVEKMIIGIKRELEEVETKQEKLKMRKIILENQLRAYTESL